jgi:hypothetical protein
VGADRRPGYAQEAIRHAQCDEGDICEQDESQARIVADAGDEGGHGAIVHEEAKIGNGIPCESVKH